VNFPQHQDESLLSQIFGFERIAQHAEAKAVDEFGVQAIDSIEGRRVSMVSLSNDLSQR
jgi:hypothetical protein